MTQEALKLALEALEDRSSLMKWQIARDAIEKALAQPEQEPVKMVAYNCTCGRTMKFESVHGVVAPQRTWVGLSEEEIDLINGGMCGEREFYQEFFRAIEAKLKEKNT